MDERVVTDERALIRAAIDGERLARREALERATKAFPGTKLARRAGVLLLDVQMLEDRIKEAGGDDELLFVLCAQVASGCTLRDWCEHYGLERGLVWSWLSETQERLDRYYRALRGVADEYVGEVVGIADESSEDTYQTDKLRVDARLKVAEKYDAGRFGRQTKVTHEVGKDFGERLRRAQERVIEGEVVSGE